MTSVPLRQIFHFEDMYFTLNEYIYIYIYIILIITIIFSIVLYSAPSRFPTQKRSHPSLRQT